MPSKLIRSQAWGLVDLSQFCGIVMQVDWLLSESRSGNLWLPKYFPPLLKSGV
ncbi:MAG: hypothetical protein ACI915_005098 [Gammaproteobacteria bacterium]|jgi:hypothetical protein